MDWGLFWTAVAAIAAAAVVAGPVFRRVGKAFLRPLLTAGVSIETVVILEPRSGEGIGYDIVLRNASARGRTANSVELSGTAEVKVAGDVPVKERVVYSVELGASVQANESGRLEGNVYEETSEDWGAPCKGEFNYEMDTGAGYESWTYSFSVPVFVPLAPREITAVRLLFKRGKRQIVIEEQDGELGGAFYYDALPGKHILTVRLHAGRSFSTPIGDEFLSFVANWTE